MTAQPETCFEVEDIYLIKDRGPCITRSEEAASRHPRRHEPGCFKPGDWVACGALRARICGIEYFAVPGPQTQRALLLSIAPEMVEVGQVWRRWYPETEVDAIVATGA